MRKAKGKIITEEYHAELQAKEKLFDKMHSLHKELKNGGLCEFDFNDQIIEILERYK